MLGKVAGALRTVLLIWTGLMFLPAWLVTVRGLFDGEAYAWGVTERIRGNGTGGYYFLAPLLALYGLGLLALGWRGVTRPFHLLLALWHIPIGVGASLAARNNREALRIKGDTLGVDVSLADVAPVVLGGVAAGSLALAALDPQDRALRGLPPRNRKLPALALAALPLQFILLRTGKHHGTTDKLGVILTISQWFLINVALALRGR
jgi:hypothetical protein